MTWTAEMDDALRDALGRGLTASQAAYEVTARTRVAVSRCAVIGRARRLGVMLRNGNSAPKQPSEKRVKLRPIDFRAKSAKNSAPLKAPQPKPEPQPEPEPVVDIVIPPSKRVALTELRETTCRFPLGDPRSGDFGFCGAPKALGPSPYCVAHARIAYVPAADRRRHDKKVRYGIRVSA